MPDTPPSLLIHLRDADDHRSWRHCDNDGYGDASGSNAERGDMNDHGVVNGDDVQLFVEKLLGG